MQKANQEKVQRHNIARIVYLELCQKFGLVGKVKCYNHNSVSVNENGRVKILGVLISKQTQSFNTEEVT